MNRFCIALCAALALAVIAGPALPEETPTGKSLVRLVCQKLIPNVSFRDRVLILEQTSTEALDEILSIHTTDGTALIDPETIVTNSAPFRLRVYNASLASGDGAEEDIIEALLSSEAGRDMNGRLMDYTGEGFNQLGWFAFKSTAPYSFLKTVDIDLEDYTGSMSTNLGGSQMGGTGSMNAGNPCSSPSWLERKAVDALSPKEGCKHGHSSGRSRASSLAHGWNGGATSDGISSRSRARSRVIAVFATPLNASRSRRTSQSESVAARARRRAKIPAQPTASRVCGWPPARR